MVGLIPRKKTVLISYVLHIFSRIIHASLTYFHETLIIQGVENCELERKVIFLGWVVVLGFFNKKGAD